VYGHAHYSMLRIECPLSIPFLLCCVHLSSKRNRSDLHLQYAAGILRGDIEAQEKVLKTENTVVVGDFNMNPFEAGMTATGAMHALPCYKLASRMVSRTVDGASYNMFYNPSWRLLGDRDQSAGTYYYSDSSHDTLYWHVFDQVVIRPRFGKRLLSDSVRVVTSICGDSLARPSGYPHVSDHFPLAFTIDVSLGEKNV